MAKKLSEHFSEDEFWCRGQDQGTCNCGHSLKIDPRLIELLEELRDITGGEPLTINSGYRCAAHNAAVGGASRSQHTMGTAADIACPNHLTMPEFLWYVEQLPFDGIGYYYRDAGKGAWAGWIHTDTRNGGIGSHIYWEG